MRGLDASCTGHRPQHLLLRGARGAGRDAPVHEAVDAADGRGPASEVICFFATMRSAVRVQQAARKKYGLRLLIWTHERRVTGRR